MNLMNLLAYETNSIKKKSKQYGLHKSVNKLILVEK